MVPPVSEVPVPAFPGPLETHGTKGTRTSEPANLWTLEALEPVSGPFDHADGGAACEPEAIRGARGRSREFEMVGASEQRADAVRREFGRRAGLEARPIDDHRSTADYRRHAVAVLAGRLLGRAFP